MKIKILLFTIFVVSIFLFNQGEAFGPPDHYLHCKRFLTETNNQISNLCKNYPEYFFAGCLEPDITVAMNLGSYYFLEGGKVYRVTHNQNFYQMIQNAATNDAEHCYAYGILLGHHIPDSYSHNFLLPDSIKTYKMQNFYWHLLTEGRISSGVLKENPEIYNEMQNALNIMFKDRRLMEITQYAVGTDFPFSVEEGTRALQSALGQDWINIYRVPEENWIGKYLWPTLATIVSSVSNYDDAKPYFEASLRLANRMGNDVSLSSQCNYNNLEIGCPLYPHGFDRLTEANAEVYSSTIIISLIMIGVLILVFAKVFKIKLFKRR